MKVLSKMRIEDMKEVFESLNKVPLEDKRRWGIHYADYGFAIDVCNALLSKMERETKRVKRKGSKKSVVKAEGITE